MTTDEALAWADKVLAHLHGMDLQHGPNEATGHLAVLAAEVRRLRQDNLELRVQLRGEADARVGDIEELSAGNATLERDLAAARAEAARLRQRVYEDNAVCLCGCPPDAHEVCDEDGGESCDNGDHTCIRVCPAAAQEFAAVRAEAARLREALIKIAYSDDSEAKSLMAFDALEGHHE